MCATSLGAGALGLPAQLRGRQIANIGSEDIGPDVWRALHDAATAAAQDPAIDGIIITHGTDTMVDTAKVLAADISLANKVIVLVGAMVPFSVSGSDALFNLGSAIMALELASPGVYIAMHGRLFGYAEVIKNRQAGQFQYC